MQSRFYAIALAAVCAAGTPATAAPLVVNYDVNFSSPEQSLWGPGGGQNGWDFDQYILGNSTFGIRFETWANTGSVSSRYNGGLRVSVDDAATVGLVPLKIDYLGDPNGGNFSTAVGLHVRATAAFPSPIPDFTIFDLPYGLDAGATYLPSPPDSTNATDQVTGARAGVGPVVPVVGGAQIGLDFTIRESATHTISALTGLAVATHETTGIQRIVPFSLGSTQTLQLNLDEVGAWNVVLQNLALTNSFSASFSLSLDPFAEYWLGVGCGDTGTDSDNFFTCGGDGRIDRSLFSIPLINNTPYGLALTSSNVLQSFQINVSDVTGPPPVDATVPEPATLVLVGSGLVAAGWRARQRRRHEPHRRA